MPGTWLTVCQILRLPKHAPEKAVWKLKPKLSFITGSLNVEMTRIEYVAGKSVAFKVFAKAIGASSTVITNLTFVESEGGGTAIHWTGDLTEVTGLLKIVPKGLIEGGAEGHRGRVGDGGLSPWGKCEWLVWVRVKTS